MNKNKLTKSVVAALLALSFCSMAYAADANPAWFETLEEKVFHLQARHLSKTTIVKTTWQIYETKTATRRGVSVTVNWGTPKEIETHCVSVEKDGSLYVAQSCYYPVLRAAQSCEWLSAKWVEDGKETVLTVPKHLDNGFVSFELPATAVDAN